MEAFQYRASEKRFEESVKLLFKVTLKKMKLDFQKRKGVFTTLSKIDSIFFAEYFQEKCDEWGLDLKIFYDPKNYREQQRKLRHDYLNLLFSSVKFRDDFFNNLDSGLVEENYIKTIPRKLENILLRFDDLFERESEEKMKKGLSMVKKYFRNNKQCKLPWTRFEIRHGIKEFKKMFYKQ